MKKIFPLNDLLLNEVGYIYDLNCSENVKKRLLDLGLVKDTCITPILKSPSNGIRAFDIRNSLIAIRNDDATKILIYTL